MKQIRIPQYSQYPIPYLDIDNYEFDENIFQTFTKKELINYEFIPLDQYHTILTVCVCKPSLKVSSDIAFASLYHVKNFNSV